MLANGGELLDYVEIIGRGQALTKPSVPFIAIPTTAGTGSEVTRNAVLASPEHKMKVSLRSPLMLARVAVVDPELTYDLPPALTASTGLDALTQLIEPYVGSRANPMTDGLCVEGIRRAARSLRAAFRGWPKQVRPRRHGRRELVRRAGIGQRGSGRGSRICRTRLAECFPAPHGAVCAALLPQVMNANIHALRQRAPDGEALRRYDEVAQLLTGKMSATADDGVEWVRHLAGDLKIPRLGTYGIKPEHVAELVKKSMQASSMKANPIVLTSEELAETLRLAL